MQQKFMNVRVRCIAADSIYANNTNKKFCTKYGISTSFVRKGSFYNFQFLSVSTDYNICNPLDHRLFAHDELNLSTVVIRTHPT